MIQFRSLSESETEIVDAVLRRFSERSKRSKPYTLDSLLERWKRFVEEVEIGYEDTIYDYVNDLEVRLLISELVESVPQSLGDEIERAVEHWDDRFRLATRRSVKPVAPGAPLDPSSWYYRVPRLLKGELAADLSSEGIIE